MGYCSCTAGIQSHIFRAVVLHIYLILHICSAIGFIFGYWQYRLNYLEIILEVFEVCDNEETLQDQFRDKDQTTALLPAVKNSLDFPVSKSCCKTLPCRASTVGKAPL